MIEAAVVDLVDLVSLPRNAKRHAPTQIAASVDAYGFLERIVVNRVTGHILSGHGRTEMLAAAKSAGQPPLVNVEARGDHWFVPVDYVEVPARLEPAAALALNRTVEIGGWDDADLGAVMAELQAVNVEIIGWDDDAIAALTGGEIDLAPPEVTGGTVGGEPGIHMREFRFSVPEAEADDVDRAFAQLRGGHRDLADGQLFVAVCRTVLKR